MPASDVGLRLADRGGGCDAFDVRGVGGGREGSERTIITWRHQVIRSVFSRFVGVYLRAETSAGWKRGVK